MSRDLIWSGSGPHPSKGQGMSFVESVGLGAARPSSASKKTGRRRHMHVAPLSVEVTPMVKASDSEVRPGGRCRLPPPVVKRA